MMSMIDYLRGDLFSYALNLQKCIVSKLCQLRADLEPIGSRLQNTSQLLFEEQKFSAICAHFTQLRQPAQLITCDFDDKKVLVYGERMRWDSKGLARLTLGDPTALLSPFRRHYTLQHCCSSSSFLITTTGISLY